MDKIPQPMTSSFLLTSGYYTKVNFQQMMTQLDNIDENTPYITGFKYMPSFRVNNKDILEVIRPIKITGTHSYRNNPVIIYFNDKGERFEYEEDLWSNDAKSKDGIYILSPELQKRWQEESLIMKGAIDNKSSLSKLPNDMINTILSQNNKLYVNKQKNPYIKQKQKDRKPLGTLDTNTVSRGGKKSKKLRQKRKTKKNRRIKKTKKHRRRTLR
jgi:hypothetical protein